MLLKVLLVTFFQLLQLTIQQDECVQPSNYSDFTLLNINGAIYLTGGSAVKRNTKQNVLLIHDIN
jgi:hypothetical protein